MNSTRTLVIGGGAVVIAALGWFFMSHFVRDTPTLDALNESLGVAFGLLIVLSVIGAIVSRRRGNPP